MAGLNSVTLICSLFWCVSHILAASNYNCTTPKGLSGYCISIKSCPRLDAMAMNKNRSRDELNLLLDSKCGTVYRQRIPKVCCDVDHLLPPDDKCGEGYSSDRIIGGTEAEIGEFPWIALIFYEPRDRTKPLRAVCGSSLINHRYVVTAAHCVTGSVLTEIGIPVMLRFGEHDRGNDDVDFEEVAGGFRYADKVVDILIDRTIPYLEFRDVNEPNYDIALIRLQDDVQFTEFIKPICLPKYDATFELGERKLYLMAAGWGVVEDNLPSALLLKVSLPYVPSRDCERRLRNFPHQRFIASISDMQICAGGKKGFDTCRGDSGGPLMHKLNQVYNLAGVTSFGPLNCSVVLGAPAVYTKVYPFISWIKNNIEP